MYDNETEGTRGGDETKGRDEREMTTMVYETRVMSVLI